MFSIKITSEVAQEMVAVARKYLLPLITEEQVDSSQGLALWVYARGKGMLLRFMGFYGGWSGVMGNQTHTVAAAVNTGRVVCRLSPIKQGLWLAGVGVDEKRLQVLNLCSRHCT